jgi:hypothetical protein
MNLQIDNNDLKILYIKTSFLYANFDEFKKECKKSYIEYFDRNTHNIEKYGQPKTFSQWINKQIIILN